MEPEPQPLRSKFGATALADSSDIQLAFQNDPRNLKNNYAPENP